MAPPKYMTIPEDEELATATVHADDYPIKPSKKKPNVLSNHFATRRNRKTQRRSSCLCWTLWIVLILVLLSILSTIALLCGAYAWTKNQVVRLSTPLPHPPAPFPVVEMSDAELSLVKDRAAMFVDTLRAGLVPEHDLVVTLREWNGWVGHSDVLRGHAVVALNEPLQRLETNWSLPLQNLPGGEGRYFVASTYVELGEDNTVTLDLETVGYDVPDVTGPLALGELKAMWDDDDQFIVNVLSGKFFNWIVPQDYIDEKENLMDLVDDCPDALAVARGIAGVVIEKDAIVVQARRTTTSVNTDKKSNRHGDTVKVVAASDSVTDYANTGRARRRTGGRLLRALLWN